MSINVYDKRRQNWVMRKSSPRWLYRRPGSFDPRLRRGSSLSRVPRNRVSFTPHTVQGPPIAGKMKEPPGRCSTNVHIDFERAPCRCFFRLYSSATCSSYLPVLTPRSAYYGQLAGFKEGSEASIFIQTTMQYRFYWGPSSVLIGISADRFEVSACKLNLNCACATLKSARSRQRPQMNGPREPGVIPRALACPNA